MSSCVNKQSLLFSKRGWLLSRAAIVCVSLSQISNSAELGAARHKDFNIVLSECMEIQFQNHAFVKCKYNLALRL